MGACCALHVLVVVLPSLARGSPSHSSGGGYWMFMLTLAPGMAPAGQDRRAGRTHCDARREGRQAAARTPEAEAGRASHSATAGTGAAATKAAGDRRRTAPIVCCQLSFPVLLRTVQFTTVLAQCGLSRVRLDLAVLSQPGNGRWAGHVVSMFGHVSCHGPDRCIPELADALIAGGNSGAAAGYNLARCTSLIFCT